MSIGQNIKQARKEVKMTQKELADKLGVYQKDISRWENDELMLSASTLAKICKILCVSSDIILEINL